MLKHEPSKILHITTRMHCIHQQLERAGTVRSRLCHTRVRLSFVTTGVHARSRLAALRDRLHVNFRCAAGTHVSRSIMNFDFLRPLQKTVPLLPATVCECEISGQDLF